MDISTIRETYKFSFNEVPGDMIVELMCESLLCMLHAALNARPRGHPEGGILRKSDLSAGYAFECRDRSVGYTICIYKK